MKATKLIQELAKYIAEYGDVEVTFCGAVLDFGGGGEANYNTLSLGYTGGNIEIYGEEQDDS